MPLSDEQKAAIATLGTIAAADLDDATKALKDSAQPVFQAVFRKGHGTAQADYEGENGKLTKALAEAAALKTRAETAEQQLVEVSKKAPDAEKLNKDWQAKLDAKDQELEVERKARKQEREARKLSDLQANLTGLDPEYARFKASEHADRLHVKDDGTVELREKDSQVPVQIPHGKTPYQVLAEEIVTKAPAALRVSNADSGGGTSGGGGGGKPSDKDVLKSTDTTVHYAI